jgi:hypothetical protein
MNSSFNSGSRRNQEGSSKVNDMKRLLGLAGLAVALSGCLIIIDDSNATLNGAAISARFQNNQNNNEFYICGNRNEDVFVTATYTGTFTSFRISLVGELNPGTTLEYGPFTFNASEGDTSTTVTRRLAITTNDIKPTDARLKTQAVVVTPTPIPPQTGNELGLGAFRAKVTMTDSFGNEQQTSSGIVRVLGNSNAQCQ